MHFAKMKVYKIDQSLDTYNTQTGHLQPKGCYLQCSKQRAITIATAALPNITDTVLRHTTQHCRFKKKKKLYNSFSSF